MYRRYDSDHMPWFLIPVSPEMETSLRHSTSVATWILVLVMLGLLFAALTPQSRANSFSPSSAATQSATATEPPDHIRVLNILVNEPIGN
jgi:hypothetical protein